MLQTRIVEARHYDGTIFPIRLSVSEVRLGGQRVWVGMIDKVGEHISAITFNEDEVRASIVYSLVLSNEGVLIVWGC
tara:strand:- start:1788 stop:2018 length:231 start_codon:yes stop_codon:yes gene_type:complete